MGQLEFVVHLNNLRIGSCGDRHSMNKGFQKMNPSASVFLYNLLFLNDFFGKKDERNYVRIL